MVKMILRRAVIDENVIEKDDDELSKVRSEDHIHCCLER